MMYKKPRKPGHIQSLIKRCKHFISRSFLNIRRGTATTSLFVKAAVNHNKERRRRAKQKYRPRYVPSICNSRGVQISSSYVSIPDTVFSPRGGYSLMDLSDLDIPVVETTTTKQKHSKSNYFNGKFCTSSAVYGVEVPNTNSSSRSSTLSSYSGYFEKNGVQLDEETMSYTSNVRGSYDDLDIDAVMDDKTFTLQRSYYLSSSPPYYLDGSCTASVQSHYVGEEGDSSLTSNQSHYMDELDVLEESPYPDGVPPNRYASLLGMSSTFDLSNVGEEGYSFDSNPSHYVDGRESVEEFCPDSVTPQNSYISLLLCMSSFPDFSAVIEKFRQQQTQHPSSNKLRLDARYGVEVPPTVSSCSVGTDAWTADGYTTTRDTQSVTGIEDELNLEDSGIDDNIKEEPLKETKTNNSFYCYPPSNPSNSAYSLMALDELNLEDSLEETKQITVKSSNLYPKKHRSVFDGVVVPKTDESLSCIEESSGVHYDFKVDKVGITVDDYKGDPKITKKVQLSSLRRTKSCGDVPNSFVVPETGGIALFSPSNCDSSYYMEDSSKEFFSCSSDSWLDKEYFVDSALARAIFDARPQEMDSDPLFSGEMENNDQLQYYNQFKAQQQFRNCAMDASNMNSFLQLLQSSFPSDSTDRLLDKLFFDYRQLVCQKQNETNFGNDKWDEEYFWL
ncbi:unnamed protein product [Meloidogyne enterolobii]|uniref:Uncharacterized protein n=1 Tax=Meloidogyne enterolobii TaxID=390850 RepID=A0ACB0ZYQ5_MELEN